MGQLIDQCDVRTPGNDGIEIHLFQRLAQIVDAPPGDDFQISNLSRRFGSSVDFDVSNDDIFAAIPQAASLVEHPPRLADSGRRSEDDVQRSPSTCLRVRTEVVPVEQLVWIRSGVVARFHQDIG